MIAFSDESVQSTLLFIADKERDKKTQLYQEDSRLDDRMSYAGGETCRLLVTEKVSVEELINTRLTIVTRYQVSGALRRR